MAEKEARLVTEGGHMGGGTDENDLPILAELHLTIWSSFDCAGWQECCVRPARVNIQG